MASQILKYCHRIHRSLLWLALTALMMFVLSALTHPLMTWTGPQPVTHFPPTLSLTAGQAGKIPEILSAQAIRYATQVKIVPGPDGAVLQLGKPDHAVLSYFDLESGQPLPDHDRKQAAWLARHYSGISDEPQSIELLTDFTAEYPSVNRLLPVYRVSFNTHSTLNIFIHTETASVASINNRWKEANQFVFRQLHTLAFLDNLPWLRVIVITLLLMALFTMLASGTVLLFRLRRKPWLNPRQWHRSMAFSVAVPLLMLLISGIYHLYQNEFGAQQTTFALHPELSLDNHVLHPDPAALDALAEQALNEASLISYQDRLYYRISFAAEQRHQHHGRAHHFEGISREQNMLLIDAVTGEGATITDRDLAIDMARHFRPFTDQQLTEVQAIHRFSPDYDFRNKRLPVWQLVIDDSHRHWLYIDTRSGILVERISNAQRMERYVFSWLHKWNFLTPLIGRENRDIVVVAVLFLLLILACAGLSIHCSRHSKQ